MSTHSPARAFDEAAWIEEQIVRYGPVVGGAVLRSLLGFRTTAAFQKARLQGQLGVAVFTLPGRKGVFAVTQEASTWVLAQRQSPATIRNDDARSPGEGVSS